MIGLRRQYFYYFRAHRTRLSQSRSPFSTDYEPAVSQPIMSAKSEVLAMKSVSKSELGQKADTTVSRLTSQSHETTASEVIDNPSFEGPVQHLTRKLATKTEVSIQDIFPSVPKKSKGKYFECSQCFHVQDPSVSLNASQWK